MSSTIAGNPTDHASDPWPHRLAVLLVCATFPLIWVGGLVTTYDAGLAVPDWPTTYGYNLFLYPWTTWLGGSWDLFIEHGHRLLGAGVGLITLALAALVWLREPSPAVRWMSVLAVVAVVGQGLLGGARVLLDERLLAQVHGTFGPAFFALSVALAVVTSRRWRQARRSPAGDASLVRLAIATTLLAYLQLALGARLRHLPLGASPAEFRGLVIVHLLLAAAVLGHVALLAWRARRAEPAVGAARPAALALALVALQLALGAGTWVANYGWPAWLTETALAAGNVVQARSLGQSLVTTAHAANGSLIVAAALAVALRSGRAAWHVPGSSAAVPRAMEAAA